MFTLLVNFIMNCYKNPIYSNALINVPIFYIELKSMVYKYIFENAFKNEEKNIIGLTFSFYPFITRMQKMQSIAIQM